MPDELHLVAFDKGMRLSKRTDKSANSKQVWGAVLFVNPTWTEGNGGEFRATTDSVEIEGDIEIEPRPGRCRGGSRYVEAWWGVP